MTGALSRYVVELKRDDVVAAVETKLTQGEDPLNILDECRQGMTKVGELFQSGEYYLAELMLSAAACMNVVPNFTSVRKSYPLVASKIGVY